MGELEKSGLVNENLDSNFFPFFGQTNCHQVPSMWLLQVGKENVLAVKILFVCKIIHIAI